MSPWCAQYTAPAIPHRTIGRTVISPRHPAIVEHSANAKYGARMPKSTSQLRDKLAHILWIGGPPDSGKTSLADLLAERHRLQVYHFDRHEADHLRRATPERQPTVVALRTLVATLDEPALAHELWLAHPPATMARFAIGSWSERVTLAVEDLLTLSVTPPIVAEGPGFFPERILPLLADHHQAIWLLPTESFKRHSAQRRNKPGNRHLTPAPDQAQENLILRDLIMADHYRQQLTVLNLPSHEIDGTLPLTQLTTHLETQLAPWLTD